MRTQHDCRLTDRVSFMASHPRPGPSDANLAIATEINEMNFAFCLFSIGE